ncbi:phage tail tip fiber protein [Vibrio quintilis]|uniref:Fibronectin type III protein n=1 Tax=Vibrio quintilis TaxID=1117707 RepID=A0A1M7YP66_9VIBR|nr:DUF1983 domain-containing protein [Vibrio quintilis]SHO54414.1 Fibronectin type III protein [Vibrio quintilis]
MTKREFRGGRSAQSNEENIEILTGQRGSGLDRAVTYRDLASTGIATLKKSGSGYTIQKQDDGSNSAGVGYPTTPAGFEVHGGFSSIMLRWDAPKYRGHAYTEVWRATTEIFADASLIATTPATVYGDIVPTGSTFYYWIRHVNEKNKPGAFNATLGTLGQTSPDISDIIDDIGEQMRQSELVQDLTSDIDKVGARVDTTEQSIEYINKNGTKAYKALWSKKASASGITAGIGLIAKSDGTSQVAISASQFFVFDPNKPGNLTPALAIDKGKVIIPQALIESATIQIIQAQEITADYVKAGISIETPTLTSAVINGAELNIGYGGPYNGYHTRITANGVIYTDYLIASGGTLDNMTINKDCKIYGTLYGVDGEFTGTIHASQIIGDVVGAKGYTLNSINDSGDDDTSKSFNVLGVNVAGNPADDLSDRLLVMPPFTMHWSLTGRARLYFVATVSVSTGQKNVYSSRPIVSGESGSHGTEFIPSLSVKIPAGADSKLVTLTVTTHMTSLGAGNSFRTITLQAATVPVQIFRTSKQLS